MDLQNILVAATAVLLIVAIAFVALWGTPEQRARPARGKRAPGDEQPEDSPATPDERLHRVLSQLADVTLKLDTLERSLADVNESTNRRFGRLYQAKSRGTLPQIEGEDAESAPGDTLQQAFPFPPPAARNTGGPTNGAGRRLLVPRR